jgi:predicted alpha-1,6-mannanase (GH76 family)
MTDRILLALVTLLLLYICYGSQQNSCLALERAREVFNRIQSKYYVNGDWIGGAIDWTKPNIMETYINYWRLANLTDDTQHSIIQSFFQKEPVDEIAGRDSFDDNLWIVLSWVRATEYYTVHPNPTYKQAALDRALLFYNIVYKKAWDETVCGGGCWWSGARDYKNAITNELWITANAQLYDLTGNATYLAMAQKTWKWFATSQMISPKYTIIDGLHGCKPTDQQLWTYNQGVILSGLGLLYKHTHDTSYLSAAFLILNGTRHSILIENDILLEICDKKATCNDDQKIFKGNYMKHLMKFLDNVPDDIVKMLRAYVQRNADAAYGAKNKDGGWNNVWVKDFEATVENALTDISVMDALLTSVKYGANPCNML